MNLIGYSIELQDLINKHIFLIFAKTEPIVFLLLLIWLVPIIEKRIKHKHNHHKTKRKINLENKAKKNTLIGQIFLSVLLIVVAIFFVKSDVATLDNLKKDLDQGSVVVYEGDAYLSDSALLVRRRSVLIDLIIDSRFVYFDNCDEHYWIDMSRVNEGWLPDSGEFNGRITYGENSRFILKIE